MQASHRRCSAAEGVAEPSNASPAAPSHGAVLRIRLVRGGALLQVTSSGPDGCNQEGGETLWLDMKSVC
ncbi:hypothetical protein WJX72_009190 [[Myrmecia] bisecta]|uniref:Uncharacterized protein n=1 Tax=[Myrmecia] bisecta TaxID=41462 RepID=A0AAW1PYA0_9CHLO